MEDRDLRYIRYTFREDGLRPIWAPHYKTEWTAYPDGKVIKRVFKLIPAIDEETFMSNPNVRLDRERSILDEKETFSVDPADVQKLLDGIQAGMRSLCPMCDASDSVKVFLFGGTIEFNPAPGFLHDFFFKLENGEQ
ncbi:MAG: hypothetical protein J5800_05305 [Spirochaetales bacterium]|nr:hypothetical protein [Spirochaetales bacterium]